mmetsp:Transcript_25956/g.86511  ORF Transcript_25956/g.86511 Transcript_25956/m.86511 type:complete len:125 (+) Transcript_25956:85-459(+)|eukprot:CAMPEP_0196669146 /NCGR_PEP_ID=MMETSP1090-20130531/439_1 /TAXON_ID=37098 /ORGANISM="Isochrysis sp, Strain CCMP1244" /LENGTH=124 /DNA_ID=CAMNT_0042006649 /DNA_START=67 /DNA_END=441 /DNA_ORIENTATION=+
MSGMMEGMKSGAESLMTKDNMDAGFETAEQGLDKMDAVLAQKGGSVVSKCESTFGPQAGAFCKTLKNGCDAMISFGKNALPKVQEQADSMASRDLKMPPTCKKPPAKYVAQRRGENSFVQKIAE